MPFPPGGSTDLLARQIGEAISGSLGQPVVVENRGGAGVTGSNAISAALRNDLPYDPVTEFDPVSIVIAAPLALVVNADSDSTSVQDVIAYAEANLESFTHDTPGVWTSMHMIGEWFDLEPTPSCFTFPTRAATLRGSIIGSFVGSLPGTGPSIASLLAYVSEKRLSKNPENVGRGALEGISAPEAANNASVQAAFIPTLSLGIPGDVVVAVLLGAMILHGITPGPNLINEQPEMFWGLIISLWIGNLMLLVLNIPLIGLWVRLLSIPCHLFYPAILVFICVGDYSSDNSIYDIFVVLGFILGPLMEEHFRRVMLLAHGDMAVFVERPISLIFLLASLAFLVAAFLLGLRKLFARSKSGSDGR